MSAAAPRSRVLLFDLGGVLVDFRGFEALHELAGDGSEIGAGIDAVRERWLASPAVRQFEAGRIEPERFARELVAEWRLAMTPDEFLEHFTGWARELFPGARELVASLAPRHRLAVLSNANVLHAAAYRPLLEPLVEALFFSFELGLLKPDPAIFEHVVGRLAIEADRITLFDDVETNVAAARAAGMRAELVRGVHELADRIDSLERAGALA